MWEANLRGPRWIGGWVESGRAAPHRTGPPARAWARPLVLVLLGAVGGHHLLGELARDFLVVRELHRVAAAAAGHGAQARLVGQHLGHRHLGPHRDHVAVRRHAHDAAATTVQVAD